MAKFATHNADAREIARVTGMYEDEVRFYGELAEKSPIRSPTCSFCHHNPNTQDALLLIEDLGSAWMVDQIDGCPPEFAESAVRELAQCTLIGAHIRY